MIMGRKEHSAASVIHGAARKSLTTLQILACLIAMGAIVVALLIQQDRSHCYNYRT
jgi:hypothetical protein